MTDKKNTDKKDAGKDAAGTPTKIGSGKPPIGGTGQSNKNFEPRPETSADDNQGPTTAEIKTVEDLETLYPQLVTKIRDEVIAQVGQCSAKQVKANMPELYERIVEELQGRSGPNLNVPGFLLEVDDPVAEGTLRAYQRLKGVDGLRLPFVLPFKDKATKKALENYILRAEGCGDHKRADAARKAMEKRK